MVFPLNYRSAFKISHFIMLYLCLWLEPFRKYMKYNSYKEYRKLVDCFHENFGRKFVLYNYCSTTMTVEHSYSVHSQWFHFLVIQAVNNPILKEILLSSDLSRVACILVYCIVAPLLEETIYRGFLLTSISSTMNWQNANLLSSLIFSAAHLSGENFIQLFIIGWVLGCTYCWTGNLKSSILLHSLYNAMTILITVLSFR